MKSMFHYAILGVLCPFWVVFASFGCSEYFGVFWDHSMDGIDIQASKIEA